MVVYQIKDTIFWKQFTIFRCRCLEPALLFIRSKIQFFESNSQFKWLYLSILNVVYQIKDTIFWKQFTICALLSPSLQGCLSDQRYNFLKAIHNTGIVNSQGFAVVYQIKDTIFWKQFTMERWRLKTRIRLFIRSKIQFFESNSQLHTSSMFDEVGCLSDQRYNFLKAIHNFSSWENFITVVVYQIKDTIFWKQFTIVVGLKCAIIALFIRSKIQFFESNSQFIPYISGFLACCLSDQRYNFLKAIHNLNTKNLSLINVVYQIKDTIFWKQFTIRCSTWNEPGKLFIRSKIQFFESNSQYTTIT